MKVYKLPAEIKALVFDMDLTLYTNAEYGRVQIDSLVEKLAGVKGRSFGEMNREVEEARESWKRAHGGKSPSLSNILLSYGIGMAENILWREETCEPERFIKKDALLAETLEKLSRRFILGLVTNNPVLVARKTLSALGAEAYFPVIVGLDTCMTAKPHAMPFLKFSELSSSAIETCVSIGDRYDIDLDIPLELGMGGILVDGVEDVYQLPEIFAVK